MAIVLAEWARLQGIPYHKANRQFRRGDLRDAAGQPVHAEKSPSGTIYVHTDEPPPGWLDHVSADQLVDKLRAAGYVVLTTEQAKKLGITSPEDGPDTS